jgi:hypothetical protein
MSSVTILFTALSAAQISSTLELFMSLCRREYVVGREEGGGNREGEKVKG